MSISSVLVDVRTREEWDIGHVNGAKLIPLDNLMSGNFDGLGKEDKIFTYCRTGSRSGLAVMILQKNGFKNVQNVGSLEAASAKFGEIVRG